jgi:hypothetical protein
MSLPEFSPRTPFDLRTSLFRAWVYEHMECFYS